MSTRASIAVLDDETGEITSVYNHSDGYPSYVGKLLLEHYNSYDKARALVALGDISVLDESIEKPEGHSFENRVDGYTVFYGRDRGETLTEAKVHKSWREYMMTLADSWYDYAYLYSRGEWLYMPMYHQELTREIVNKE